MTGFSFFLESRKDETEKIVNTNNAFFSVLQRNVNEKRILFSAEIDCCVQGDDQKPPLNYVEIKTSKQLENFNQQTRFYKKKCFTPGDRAIWLGFQK